MKKVLKVLGIIVAVLLACLILLVSCVIHSDKKNDTVSDEKLQTTTTNTDTTEQFESEAPEKENATMGEKNALKKAEAYLSFTAFSYNGLIEQLEFEGFTHEEAVYGVDNCNADWMEQAAKKAEEYLNVMAFSRQGLIEQLEFEGFTSEEATYGVDSVGL